MRPAHPPFQGSEPKPTLHTRAAWAKVGPRACKCWAKSHPSTMSSIRHVLPWSTHHNLINLINLS